MISSIRLQDFKGHRDTTVPLGRFTALVGPNGSGKTSVLEALWLQSRLAYEPTRDVLAGDYAGKDLRRRGASQPFTLTWTGTEAGEAWSEANGEGGSNRVEGARVATAPRSAELYKLNAEQIAAAAYSDRPGAGVERDGTNTAVALAALKLGYDEAFGRVEEEMRLIVPSVERVRIRQANVARSRDSVVGSKIHFDFRSGAGVPAHLASEGTLITLALLTILHSPDRPGVILLDDFDQSLHPRAQMELVRLIKRLLAEIDDLQIVATTHSPYVLDELDPLRDPRLRPARRRDRRQQAPLRAPRGRADEGLAHHGPALDARPRARVGDRGQRLVRLLVFCEAEGDFRTAAGLVDRVLREEGPAWVADLIDAHPEAIREWIGDGLGPQFFDVHDLSHYEKTLKVLVPQGHFDGKPRAPDARMARRALYIAREVRKRQAVDAVLIVRDMDDQGKERRVGLDQARVEARRWAPFAIVVGWADPMREAWVLAGFEPESDEERDRVRKLREKLGFHPCEAAHELGAKNEQAKRSSKRVLGKLTLDDKDREARCWTHAPLDWLRSRGEQSGLRAFLDEVKEHVVPLCG